MEKTKFIVSQCNNSAQLKLPLIPILIGVDYGFSSTNQGQSHLFFCPFYPIENHTLCTLPKKHILLHNPHDQLKRFLGRIGNNQ